MKKIITAVALVVSAYGFSTNCVKENVKLKNVENSFIESVSYDEFFGTCNFTIYKISTDKYGNTVSTPLYYSYTVDTETQCKNLYNFTWRRLYENV